MDASDNREAAFLAKITASTTHEIRNVLAIVKESAGLIGDMMHAFAKRGSLNQEKLLRTVRRIDAQVSRGANIVSNLNRFAHSLDNARDSIDLADELQQIAFLCERFARQGGHQVQVQSGDPGLNVETNSLRLHMVLFTAVECCFERMTKPGTVTMQAGRWGDAPAVEFVGEIGDGVVVGAPAGVAGWSRLEELVDSLGASVEADDAACRFRVILPVSGGG
jgi:C4-dicarboxylate-specific signal transduction histidine kinase